MRTAAVQVLLAITALTALVAQSDSERIQPSQTTVAVPPTVRVEIESQKQKESSLADTLKAAAELLGVLLWPSVFVTLLVTQRKPLTRLLDSVVELVTSSTHIKLGDFIDVEVNRSALQAEQNDSPAREVPAEEAEAAARVSRLVGESELPGVRERMLEFAREYEATRSNMKPGPERTRAMNAIVAKMRTLAIAARPLLREFATAGHSPGISLVALSILQLRPNLEYVPWLVDCMSAEQAFVLFHASLGSSCNGAPFSFSCRSEAQAGH
jgi:hypothetical protein